MERFKSQLGCGNSNLDNLVGKSPTLALEGLTSRTTLFTATVVKEEEEEEEGGAATREPYSNITNLECTSTVTMSVWCKLLIFLICCSIFTVVVAATAVVVVALPQSSPA